MESGRIGEWDDANDPGKDHSLIEFFYGVNENYENITDKVLEHCVHGNEVVIPADDFKRYLVFADPAPGFFKGIVAVRKVDSVWTCMSYDARTDVRLKLLDDEVPAIHPRRNIVRPPAGISTADKLRFLHSQLKLYGGNFQWEWSEQAMSVEHLAPDSKVLELGSNIGRNTLIIASLLDDDRNLVTLECDPTSVAVLEQNRFVNRLHFQIEPSALSSRKLMLRGWETIPSEELREGYRWVSTITYEDLKKKYPINFDTLVIDCEGAIYYILQDTPAVLENISTILLESDYQTVEHKAWVDDLFRQHGLEKVYSEPLVGHENESFPPECRSSFYEVWKK